MKSLWWDYFTNIIEMDKEQSDIKTIYNTNDGLIENHNLNGHQLNTVLFKIRHKVSKNGILNW